MNIEFEIKQNSRGFIVTRSDGIYEHHSHVSTINGARLLISLIRDNKLPQSDYLKISARRLLSEKEYSQLKQKKQQYYNVNKGVRQ